MALPSEGNGTFAPVAPRASNNKALRVASIGMAVILACAALVALVGDATEAPRSELVALNSKESHISALAREFLQKGAEMSQAEAMDKIRNWNEDRHVARHVHVLMFLRRSAHQIWRFDSIRVAIERKDVKEMLGLAAHYTFMLTFVSPLTFIG